MYDAEPDPYCYPDTSVLKNLLDLRVAADLEAFEADAVTQRGDETLPSGGLSAQRMKHIHRHLFQDVYAWAGEYRTVRIAKDGSVFCYPEHIERQMALLFDSLAQDNYLRGLAASEFALRCARFLSELNAIHPFREGNGRTQMIFFALLAEEAGHPLDLDRLAPETFLAAMIRAFKGDESALAVEIEAMLL